MTRAQLGLPVPVDELLLADVALEVLHAEVDGAGVDGQAILAVESLPTVVAHEARIVIVLPQVRLNVGKFKLIYIKI